VTTVAVAAPRRRAAVPASLHPFRSGAGAHLLVVDGSRVFDIDDELYSALVDAVAADLDPLRDPDLAQAFGMTGRPVVGSEPLAPPPVTALSLNVVHACNLACTYCYADGGDFGGPSLRMAEGTAERAVRMLVEGAEPGARVHVAFLGGEPLLHRSLVRHATEHARRLGAERGVATTFAITTNGTLVTSEDAAFFGEHAFAVTVSVDGVGDAHNGLRPTRAGRPTYDGIARGLGALLAAGVRPHARVTVTPRNLHLRSTLVGLLDAGFTSVGFSPMLASPTGADELSPADLVTFLDEMVECARLFEDAVLAGKELGFANAATALQEIHRGTARPYACGAGAGYLSVGAEGSLSACHRFVNEPAGAMGSLDAGVDDERRARWLAGRHVHRQQPCAGCWARYLCGGGCHHEVLARGRPACEYVLGWLDHCLGMYVRLLDARPDWFAGGGPGR